MLIPWLRPCLGVLFASEGRMEQEVSRRIGAPNCIHSIALLSRKAKRSIYWSILVPTLTYGPEGWVITKITRSRVQVAETGFLRRVAGISLRDRVRCSVIREELGVEPLLICVIKAS